MSSVKVFLSWGSGENVVFLDRNHTLSTTHHSLSAHSTHMCVPSARLLLWIRAILTSVADGGHQVSYLTLAVLKQLLPMLCERGRGYRLVLLMGPWTSPSSVVIDVAGWPVYVYLDLTSTENRFGVRPCTSPPTGSRPGLSILSLVFIADAGARPL